MVEFMNDIERYSRTIYDMKLRRYLDSYEDTLKGLSEISLVSYCGVDFHPLVYGFIIPVYKFTSEKILPIKYVYVMYAKLPGKKILYTSDHVFQSLDKCKEEAQFFLKYFPLYGALKRNIYVRNSSFSYLNEENYD